MAMRADRVEGRKRANAARATLMAEVDKRETGEPQQNGCRWVLLR